MEKDQLKQLHEVNRNKNELKEMRAQIEKNVQDIKSNMSTGDFGIDDVLDRYTEEEIANMSYQQIKETFVNEEGVFVFNEEEFKPELIHDFIKYLKMSRITFERLDEEFEKMESALADFNKEINETITAKGSLNKVILDDAKKILENDEADEESKENAKKVLQGLENAKTLAPLFELYSKLSTENTLRELKDESKRISTLKAYSRVCKENGIEPKLLKLGGFEMSCLDEKYSTYKNLFIFVLARYVKYLDKKVREPQNLSFVIQVTNYIRTMMMGEEAQQYQADREEIEILRTNICLLLDKFYN